MTSQDIFSLFPFLSVLSTSILVMLYIACHRSHKGVALISIVGLFIAFLSTLSYHEPKILLLLHIDSFSIMLIQGLIITSIITMFFTYEYMKTRREDPEELYLLFLLSTLGSLILAASNNFVSLFLGLELLTIPLYCAIAYTCTDRKSIEAGIKYIILAGLAAALMLFGIALIYAATGTMDFTLLGQSLAKYRYETSLFLGGVALIFAALSFKISAVPFHLWTPDVYDGAALPATMFLATVSKSASLVVILRLWLIFKPHAMPELFWLLTVLAILSMLVGNLLALKQENIKRLVAYSSIAHFGYLTMAVVAAAQLATQALLLYLVAYVITILIIFGVLMLLEQPHAHINNIADLRGLFKKEPFLACVFMLALLSLMGLPLTALFMAKFLVIMAAIESSLWSLVISLIISSALGIFVYLRVAQHLFGLPDERAYLKRIKPIASAVVALLALCLITLGIWPTPATEHIRANNTQSLSVK